MHRVAMGASFSFPFLSLLLFSFVIIASSVSAEIILAPPPYRLVNVGLCDY